MTLVRSPLIIFICPPGREVFVQNVFQWLQAYDYNLLVIGVSLLSFTFFIFMFLWIYNKRKFQNLKHQIPASVMKTYLDAIIQNSTALKSSLLRGAVDDIDPSGIPFVFPLQSPVGTSAAGLIRAPKLVMDSGDIDSELMNSKMAEITSLKSQIEEKDGIIKELELKTMETLANFREAQDKLARQEKDAGATPLANDSELVKQLEEVTTERDALKERLKEYEIIEHDLAEIPRMQREIDQLKKSLSHYEGQSAGDSASLATPLVSSESSMASSNEQEMLLKSTDDDIDMETAMKEMESMNSNSDAANAANASASQKSEVAKEAEEGKAAKVDDELLSQFEKMLS